MAAILIDGKTIATEIKLEVKDLVSKLRSQGVHPCLAVILVGTDPASHAYVSAKRRMSQEVGIRLIQHNLLQGISEFELISLIHSLNADSEVHGILVQLPLPTHIEEHNVIEAISPEKDVDGFHPCNVGCLVTGLDTLISCTPHAVSQLMTRSGISTSGKHTVIVGRSNIVGKPLMNLLVQKTVGGNSTVTVCHSGTKNIKNFTVQADILIVAIGKARLVSADMIKPGAVVIDVGINRVEENGKTRLIGDVDFDHARNVASMITPVPGGVGPMTVAMLMKNVVKAATWSIRT